VTQHRSAWRTYAALTAVLLLWPSAFVGIRASLQFYSAGEVALLRYLVASLVLIVYCIAKKVPLIPLRDWPLTAVAGFMGFSLYSVAVNRGEATVTAAAASFIVNTVPIFSSLLAVAFLGERTRAVMWFGTFVSIVGTFVIALGEGKGIHFDSGVLYLLVAAIAQAVYFVLQKPLLSRHSALQVTSLAIWTGTLLLLPYLSGLWLDVPRAPHAATIAVLYLGTFPTIIGYVAWAYVLSKMPISSASPFLYIVPVNTILIGWIWLREMPSGLSIAGGCLSLLGVAIMKRRAGIS